MLNLIVVGSWTERADRNGRGRPVSRFDESALDGVVLFVSLTTLLPALRTP